MDPHVPPRVADDRECAAGATTGGGCLFLLGSDSSGLDSCSTDRDSEELSMDLENAFSGDNVGLQSFGVVAAENTRPDWAPYDFSLGTKTESKRIERWKCNKRYAKDVNAKAPLILVNGIVDEWYMLRESYLIILRHVEGKLIFKRRYQKRCTYDRETTN